DPVVKHDPSRMAAHSARLRPLRVRHWHSDHYSRYASGGPPKIIHQAKPTNVSRHVALPAEWALSLFGLYRRVNRHSDHEAKLRADETHRLIHAYMGATYAAV